MRYNVTILSYFEKYGYHIISVNEGERNYADFNKQHRKG
ncbi:hypothetical protein D081_0489 [Anaerovibrio sp. JC8]|nr:hypothetical protein D081_0489 [Anaerovibrio sp. JC8]